jgi:polyketide synthase PksL
MGSYGCLIVEEWPASEIKTESSISPVGPQLILLSARSLQALRVKANQLYQFVRQDTKASLADLAYTLQIGREPMAFRWAVVADSMVQLSRSLEHYLWPSDSAGEMAPDVMTNDPNDQPLTSWKLLDKEAETLVLNKYISDRNLNKLGLCWVHGASISWPVLYVPGSVTRIYPLAAASDQLQAS